MLSGYDVAGSFQPPATIQQRLSSGAFFICKTTQGLHTNIALYPQQLAVVRNGGKLVGHYHYAELANNGTDEANHFLSYIQWRKGEIVALDFEPYDSPNNPQAYPGYIAAFAQTVHAKLGIWPWLYANDFHLGIIVARASVAQLAIIRQMPLWKAGVNDAYVPAPSNGPGNIHGWAVCTAFQWHATGIDSDVFFGDSAAWKTLGGLVSTPTPVPPPPAPAITCAITSDVPTTIRRVEVMLTANASVHIPGSMQFQWFNGTAWTNFGGVIDAPVGFAQLLNAPNNNVQYRAVFTPKDTTKPKAVSAPCSVRVLQPEEIRAKLGL